MTEDVSLVNYACRVSRQQYYETPTSVIWTFATVQIFVLRRYFEYIIILTIIILEKKRICRANLFGKGMNVIIKGYEHPVYC